MLLTYGGRVGVWVLLIYCGGGSGCSSSMGGVWVHPWIGVGGLGAPHLLGGGGSGCSSSMRGGGSGCCSPMGEGVGWGGGGGGWSRGSGTHPALRWGCKTQVWNWGGGGGNPWGGSQYGGTVTPPTPPQTHPHAPHRPHSLGVQPFSPSTPKQALLPYGAAADPPAPPPALPGPPLFVHRREILPWITASPPLPNISPPPISLPTPTTSSEGRLGLCTPLAPLGGGPSPLPPPHLLGSLPSFPVQRRSVWGQEHFGCPPPPKCHPIQQCRGWGGGAALGSAPPPLQPPAHPPLVGQ